MNPDDIAAVFHRKQYKAMTAREIARALDVDQGEVEACLRDLETAGRVTRSGRCISCGNVDLWRHRGPWITEAATRASPRGNVPR